MKRVKLANIISILFHPLLVTFLSSLVIMNNVYSNLKERIFYSIVILFSVLVLPFSILSILKFFGVISDLDISDKKEREKLVVFGSLVMLVLIELLIVIFVLKHKLFLFLVLVLFFMYIVGKLILKKIKSSGHISIFLINVLFLSYFIDLRFLFGIVFVILIFWSRIELGRHNQKECFAGLILGLVSVLFLLLMNRIIYYEY